MSVEFFDFLLDSMGLNIIFLFGHLFFHFSQIEEFRGFFDLGAELEAELVFELETLVMVFCLHVGDTLLALLMELIHFVGPELVDFVELVVKLSGQLVALFFVGEFHFVELFVFELLLTMLPFHPAPFCIHILAFLLMLDHLLTKQSQVVIQAEHPTGRHELTHLTQFFYWQ